jgi:hypothetical protein
MDRADEAARPASRKRIEALMERGFHRAGDVDNRLGFLRRSNRRMMWIGSRPMIRRAGQ